MDRMLETRDTSHLGLTNLLSQKSQNVLTFIYNTIYIHKKKLFNDNTTVSAK